jgi:hypothetical protein
MNINDKINDKENIIRDDEGFVFTTTSGELDRW